MKAEVRFVVETELRTDRSVEVEAKADVKLEERNKDFLTAVVGLCSKHDIRYESVHAKEFELTRYEVLEKFDKTKVLEFFNKFKEDVIALLYDAKELAEKTKMKIEEEYSLEL